MTFRNFWKELWLWFCYGEWVVIRKFSHYRDITNFGLASVKAEGSVVEYDTSAVYTYSVGCPRTGVTFLCESKREAEGMCALCNDLRGE